MDITKKSLGLLISLLLILLISSCSKSPEKQLVGEWTGTDSTGATATHFFNDDGTASMISGNIVFDGSSEGISLKWKLVSTYDPMHLDLIASNSEKTLILPMIARFVGENKLQLRRNKDYKGRPTDFTSSDDRNQILLFRQ